MEKLTQLMQKYENYLEVAEPRSNIKMPFVYAQRHEEEKAKAAAALKKGKGEKNEKKATEAAAPVEQVKSEK
jgi:hypothetical protein